MVPGRRLRTLQDAVSAFLQEEDLWLSSGFLKGWEPPNFSGNNQRADNSRLLTCSGCHGWWLKVLPPPEGWDLFLSPLGVSQDLALGFLQANGPKGAKAVS